MMASLPRSNYAARLGEFPDIACAEAQAFARRGAWNAFFAERIGGAFGGRIVFEIGCFDAAFLCRVARKHPQVGFVGLDWKCKAIYEGASRVRELGLTNVVLLRARAQDITRIFGPRELDEIWVFHPDPCDRPAELKNRLLAERFMRDASTVLRDATSTLTLKTDHLGYYESSAALSGEPLLEMTANSSDYWNDASLQARLAGRAFADEITLFEARFLRRRQPIYFVEWTKRLAAM